MEYMSYGQSCIIFIVVLLVISNVLLDLLPLLYKRLCRGFVSSPIGFINSRIAPLLTAVTHMESTQFCYLLGRQSATRYLILHVVKDRRNDN